MESVTKTKIILFSSLGILLLIIVGVCIAFMGGKSGTVEDNVNTSLRAQEQSDFTLDDMLKANDGRPEYEKFGEYEQPAETKIQDPEILALQEQLRENQGGQPDTVQPKKRIAPKKKTAKKQPEPQQPPKPESRFFSSGKEENTGNTVEAIVSGDQKITDGSVIKLVTLHEIPLENGVILQKGSALFGVVKLEQDRISVTIQSVRIGNSIYDLKKQVYDRDGLPGIYVPLNIKAEATKEAAGEVVNDMNVTPYSSDVLSTSVNAVSSAAKSVFRKKNNQVIVTVKSNYKLYLK